MHWIFAINVNFWADSSHKFGVERSLWGDICTDIRNRFLHIEKVGVKKTQISYTRSAISICIYAFIVKSFEVEIRKWWGRFCNLRLTVFWDSKQKSWKSENVAFNVHTSFDGRGKHVSQRQQEVKGRFNTVTQRNPSTRWMSNNFLRILHIYIYFFHSFFAFDCQTLLLS